MRDYAKVGPQFWNGATGKALKKQGQEAVMVAFYLLTCQHANMLGLYYLSQTYIAVDTGLGLEGACKGLQGACEAGFCRYDRGSEVVWIPQMAAYQIGGALDAKDNRCKGVQREYDALPENPFLHAFFERYARAYHMTTPRGTPPKKVSPSRVPRKPLRSQEQEQEQEKEQEQEHEQEQDLDAGPRAKRSTPPRPKTPGALAFDAYALAYEAKYGARPLTNAKVRSQMSQLVGRVPAEEAPEIAAWFVGHPQRYYAERGHSIDCLLRDAEKLRTEWATGKRGTSTQALLGDRTQANFNAFGGLIAEAKAKEANDGQREIA
jgi:hypothetical protein